MKLLILLVIISYYTINIYGLGEESVIDIDSIKHDKELKQHLINGVYEYNRKAGQFYAYIPYQIHSVKKQLAAGFLYKFQLTLVGSKCKYLELNLNLYDCKLNEDLTPKRVEIHVLDQPWMVKTNPYQVFIIKDEDATNLELHDQLFILGVGDGDNVAGMNFGNFKEQYNKKYENNLEEEYRYKVFQSNFKKSVLLNLIEQGTATYGVTEFSDLTAEEFRKTRLSPAWDLTKKPSRKARIPRMTPPTSVDWRAKGAVTPVKNQGSCGSCWAFSTTGNIEGQWFMKSKKLVSLSEQQLVDCDKIDSGCQGGLPSQAYKAIEQMGGLETESEYPYDAHKETCHFSKAKVRAFINDSITISSQEEAMAAWCAMHGPISIGINAFAMQFYRGGISHPFKILCNPDHLDHGVLIVGYAVTGTGEPFWIIKNSWGPNWGEKGYYLVYRGAGVCGLNKMPTSSVVE